MPSVLVVLRSHFFQLAQKCHGLMTSCGGGLEELLFLKLAQKLRVLMASTNLCSLNSHVAWFDIYVAWHSRDGLVEGITSSDSCFKTSLLEGNDV